MKIVSNSKIERPVRDNHKLTRISLTMANLPPILWCFARQHAIYVRRRTCHTSTGYLPYLACHYKKSNYNTIKSGEHLGQCSIVIQSLLLTVVKKYGLDMEIMKWPIYTKYYPEKNSSNSTFSIRFIPLQYPISLIITKLQKHNSKSESLWHALPQIRHRRRTIKLILNMILNPTTPCIRSMTKNNI